MKRDRILHILHFLHFAHNLQRPDKGKEYDRLWKLRTVFDKLKEIIVKFKGRVIFRQYIPKKENISASIFTNSVMNQGIHMT